VEWRTNELGKAFALTNSYVQLMTGYHYRDDEGDLKEDPNNLTYFWDVPSAPGIASPQNNASYSSGGSVPIIATFPASGCSVAKVDFFINNSFLASITSFPHSYTWTQVPVGKYTVTAVATYGDGKVAFSQPITFTAQ
jgi:hypothetical protein